MEVNDSLVNIKSRISCASIHRGHHRQTSLCKLVLLILDELRVQLMAIFIFDLRVAQVKLVKLFVVMNSKLAHMVFNCIDFLETWHSPEVLNLSSIVIIELDLMLNFFLRIGSELVFTVLGSWQFVHH